jgi:elongation of very long chain fatty acids protein 4
MCEATLNQTVAKVTAQMPLNPTTSTVEGRPIASSMPPTITNMYKESNSDTKPLAPSLTARYTCAGGMVAIFAVWGQCTFGVVEDAANVPVGDMIHSWTVPGGLCLFYLVSLPILKVLCQRYLWNTVDTRALLTEAMVVYNAGQVLLNGWMCYRIIDALINNNHPFIRGTGDLVTTGTTYAVWVHYCDKYLEFMDTYFMVLRGKMDQVRKCQTQMYCVA